MKVVITGTSGFLGKHLIKVFQQDEVLAIGRNATNIICDLSNQVPEIPSMDMVIHAAGKAHSVPKTPQQKQDFFDVNVTGTQNLLKGLERAPALPKSFVFISSVSVYGLEKGENIRESHPLNAKDPYGLSKIQAEQLIQEWCEKNKVICTILRLPLLVGENPPGNLGAMIRGIKNGYYFNIAGGGAKKSMVFAQDVAKIIPQVAKIGGTYNLTDGYHPSFAEFASLIAKELGKKNIFNLPFWLANTMAKFGDMLGNKAPINSKKLAKITADLTFDDLKAKNELNWKPKSVLAGWK